MSDDNIIRTPLFEVDELTKIWLRGLTVEEQQVVEPPRGAYRLRRLKLVEFKTFETENLEFGDEYASEWKGRLTEAGARFVRELLAKNKP